MGNVGNACTASEFYMASNSLTRLQEDQTNQYERKPSQLGVVTSPFGKTGPSLLWISETGPWPNKSTAFGESTPRPHYSGDVSPRSQRHLHNNPHRSPSPFIQPAYHGVCQPLPVMCRPHRGRTTTPHTLPIFIHIYIYISYSSLSLYIISFALFHRMHATTTDQR